VNTASAADLHLALPIFKSCVLDGARKGHQYSERHLTSRQSNDAANKKGALVALP
jgi:hypothetical protein